MTESEILVVYCTCPVDQGERLASLLVDRRLAACVNIVPRVTSVYRWEGKLQKDPESLLVIKCPASGYGALEAALLDAHPYDVPEVIGVPVQRGSEGYLSWVIDETRTAGGESQNASP